MYKCMLMSQIGTTKSVVMREQGEEDEEGHEKREEELVEKKTETRKEKVQMLKYQDGRTINSLPLHSPHNYTPYFNLEFDITVQDYCRNLINQIKLNKHSESLHDGGVNHTGQQINSKQTSKKRSSTSSSSASLFESLQFYKNIKSNINNNNYCSPISANQYEKIARNCKVVVSGDVAVGKTCLVNRFGHAIYSSTYRTTIGVDFDLQRFTILGQPYVLQIWDTAGLERFKCVTSSYYRGCQVALIVFDMSNMSSLANVLKWRDEILISSKTFEQLSNEFCGYQIENNNNSSGNHNYDTIKLKPDASNDRAAVDGQAPLLFLVGTKCDLPLSESSRTFMVEQANKIASLIQAELWFVSAQTGENVNELFTRIAALSFNRCIQNELCRLKFEASTMGTSLKEKLMQQQRDLWNQSSKLIKITKKKDGDDRRSRCVNVQCVIK